MALLSRITNFSSSSKRSHSDFTRFGSTDTFGSYPHRQQRQQQQRHAPFWAASSSSSGPIGMMMGRLGKLHASEKKWVQFSLAWLPVALALANWIIQLLVSIGLPSILSIDFLRFDLSFKQFSIFGIWTICTGTPEETLFDGTVINPASSTCPPSSLGWSDTTYSTIVQTFFGSDGSGLPRALIVHPIACAFSFFALLSLLVGVKRPNVSAPLLVCIAFLLTLVSFIIDLALFVPAHRRLSDPSAIDTLGQGVIDVRYGAAFWLTLVALILTALLTLLVLSAHKSRRRQRNHHGISAAGWSYEMDKPLTSSDREATALAPLGPGVAGAGAGAGAQARGDPATTSSLHSLSRHPSRTTSSTPTAFAKASSSQGGKHSRNASSNLNLDYATSDVEGALDHEVDYGSRGRRKALEKLEDKDKDE